jgi:hypothetical protein
MKVALATTQPNDFFPLRIAILTQSGEGEFQRARIFTTQNRPKWTPGDEKRRKTFCFTIDKKTDLHHSRME